MGFLAGKLDASCVAAVASCLTQTSSAVIAQLNELASLYCVCHFTCSSAEEHWHSHAQIAPIIIPPNMPLPFIYRIVNSEGFNYGELLSQVVQGRDMQKLHKMHCSAWTWHTTSPSRRELHDDATGHEEHFPSSHLAVKSSPWYLLC
jgi:hypothetical protein